MLTAAACGQIMIMKALVDRQVALDVTDKVYHKNNCISLIYVIKNHFYFYRKEILHYDWLFVVIMKMLSNFYWNIKGNQLSQKRYKFEKKNFLIMIIIIHELEW